MSAEPAEPAAPTPESPFRYKAFNLFFSGRVFATLATQAQGVAVAWQVYALARERGADVQHAAFDLGLIGLAQFLPVFVLTLPAGEMADRRDRKQIVMLSLMTAAACSAVFLALTLSRHPPFWALLLNSALIGVTRAMLAPSSQAMGPMLVPREVLPRAIALNSLAFLAGSIAGPGVGGLLVDVSPAFAYGGALVLYLSAAAAMSFIGVKTVPEPQEGPPLDRWRAIREGLVWVWKTKIVFGAISLDLVAVLLGGATALLPVYARDILHVGANGFGLMRAAPSVGAAAMALVLSRWHVRRRAGPWMLACVAVFGLATIVFALSPWPWVSLAALAVLGASDMISVYIRSTLIQIVTPDAMRGRVSAVSMLFVGASNELGEFESGFTARILGAVGSVLCGGIGSILTVGLWAWWFPDLRKADRLS